MSNAHHVNVPAHEYHDRSEWSQSQWKLLPSAPEEFYGKHVRLPKESRWRLKPTPDMELGTQLHAVLLENEPLLIIPYTALTSNGQRRGKNWEAWCDEHPDNHGVLEKDSARIRAMCESCRNEPVIRELLEAEGEVEHTIIWRDDATQLDCRARLDKISRFPNGYIIPDLKSTGIDVTNKQAVEKRIFEGGYHQQAAAYWDAASMLYGPPIRFVFIFVRNSPPFTARAWYLEEADMDLGRRHNAQALGDLRERLTSNQWNGAYFGQLNLASLPKYAWTDDPLCIQAPYQEFDEYQ